MQLRNEQLKLDSVHTLNPLFQYFCPECGSPMVEADRLSEQGGIYIWHRCSRPGCVGSWLQKKEKYPSARHLS